MKGNQQNTNNDFEEFRIKVTLNPSLCDRTFKNNLRATDKGHGETLLASVNPQFRKKRDQASSIFSAEPNSKQESHKQPQHMTSTVMFNDSYVEKNPKINKGKIIRYLFEKQIKNESHLYSDDLYISPEKQKTIERRIRDNYGTNPLSLVTSREQEEYNKIRNEKNAKRQEGINDYLGSDNVRKTFRTIKNNSSFNDYSSNITKQAYCLVNNNSKQILNDSGISHQKRHFRIASLNGKAFSYF